MDIYRFVARTNGFIIELQQWFLLRLGNQH